MENVCKGIPNVEFVGFKTGKELHKLIAEAAVFNLSFNMV